MDNLRKLSVDLDNSDPDIKVDDFIVTIGVKKSNSVYHVAKSIKKQIPKNPTVKRFNIQCYKSDLITAIKRDKSQLIFPVHWK